MKYRKYLRISRRWVNFSIFFFFPVQVTSEIVASAISNGSINLINKVLDGEDPTLEDFGQGAITGAVGGLLGTITGHAAGHAAKKVISSEAIRNTVGHEIGDSTTTFARMIAKSATQSAGNATGNALVTFVSNLLNYGKISK